MNFKRSTLMGVVMFAGLTAMVAAQNRPAADWTQWRGANRDGAVASFTEPTSWPENLTQKWKVDVGLGYASPLVVGNRLYLFSRQADDE